MNRNSVWLWVSAAFVCTTILASYAALHYSSLAESYKRNYQGLLEDLESLTILVNIKIDYGNGTVVWYNDTRVPVNSTLLTATKIVSSVEYTTSALGAFVNKINGVGDDPNIFWMWHFWDTESRKWESGPVGSGQWILHSGDVVSWTYSSF